MAKENQEINLEDLNRDRDHHKQVLEDSEKMKRLLENKDFKDLFLEEFLLKGALNTTRLLHHETTKDEGIRKQYENKLVSIGVVQNFIDAKRIEGKEAERMINEIDNYIASNS